MKMKRYRRLIVVAGLIANASLHSAASTGLPAAASAVAGGAEVKKAVAFDEEATQEMWGAIETGNIQNLRKVLATRKADIHAPMKTLMAYGHPVVPLYYAIKHQAHRPLIALALLEYGANATQAAPKPVGPQPTMRFRIVPLDPNYTMVHAAAEIIDLF